MVCALTDVANPISNPIKICPRFITPQSLDPRLAQRFETGARNATYAENTPLRSWLGLEPAALVVVRFRGASCCNGECYETSPDRFRAWDFDSLLRRHRKRVLPADSQQRPCGRPQIDPRPRSEGSRRARQFSSDVRGLVGQPRSPAAAG